MSGYTRGQTITVTAVAAFTALLIGIAVGRSSLDGIKEWQTALGALIALTAVIVAFWNVRRQLRMTLVTREEARMEEHHPGLQQALSFIRFLNIRLGVQDIHQQLLAILIGYKVRG